MVLVLVALPASSAFTAPQGTNTHTHTHTHTIILKTATPKLSMLSRGKKIKKSTKIPGCWTTLGSLFHSVKGVQKKKKIFFKKEVAFDLLCNGQYREPKGFLPEYIHTYIHTHRYSVIHQTCIEGSPMISHNNMYDGRVKCIAAFSPEEMLYNTKYNTIV